MLHIKTPHIGSVNISHIMVYIEESNNDIKREVFQMSLRGIKYFTIKCQSNRSNVTFSIIPFKHNRKIFMKHFTKLSVMGGKKTQKRKV